MPLDIATFIRDALAELGPMHVHESFEAGLRSRAQLLSVRNEGYDPEEERRKFRASVEQRVLQAIGGAKAEQVAVVPIVGTLYNKSPWWDETALTYAEVADMVNKAAGSRATQVMLYVDSPGGSARGQAVATSAIANAARAKNVVAQSGGLIASAAYALASQARTVVADRQDMIGSLGTISMMYDTSEAAKQDGISPVVVERDGALKALGAFGVPVSAEMKQEMQRLVDGYHADFKASIMAGRKLDDAGWQSVSGGRVWLGHQAGRLVDGVASPAETHAKMLVAAGAVRNPVTGGSQAAVALSSIMSQVAAR